MIRSMKLDDYKNVFNLWSNTAGMGLNPIDDSIEGIAKYLQRNPHTCFVAEHNGEIVGVILGGHDGRRGFIHHTAVKEEYRGRGIGTSLVNSALASLESEDIHKVALVVFEENESGNRFWEKAGFTIRDDLIYRNKHLPDHK